MFAAHAFGKPTRQSGHRVDHLKVLTLWGTHHVEQLVRLEIGHAVAHRRQVRRRVAVALVALLHDERQGLALTILESRGEHAQRAVTLGEQALGRQVVHDVVEHVVVVRLTDRVTGSEGDVEFRVDLGEIRDRFVDEDSPQSARLGVARLQSHDARAAAVFEGVVLLSLIHIFDDARTFVATYDRKHRLATRNHLQDLWFVGDVTVTQVLVGETQARKGHLDLHLVGMRLVDLDDLGAPGPFCLSDNSGFDLHIPPQSLVRNVGTTRRHTTYGIAFRESRDMS